MVTDTSADVAAAQASVYRRMTPEERVRIASEMSEAARQIAVEGIRSRHPQYTDDDVLSALFRAIHGDELFRLAWPHRPLLVA